MTISATSTKQRPSRLIKALLVDLDDTLYRAECVPRRVREEIERYMVDKLQVPAEQVQEMTSTLYAQHGTTYAGLVAKGYQIDVDDWHRRVHHEALDYDALFHPDIQLREILCSIDVPKYILTNADTKHAKMCLDRLGVSDCFQGIFDFEWAQSCAAAHNMLTEAHPVLCKPSHQVYRLALEEIGCEPHEVVFFDDSHRNILAAHQVGLTTVLVGSDHLIQGSDLAIPTMAGLPAALPELLDQPGLVHDAHSHHALEERITPQVMEVARV